MKAAPMWGGFFVGFNSLFYLSGLIFAKKQKPLPGDLIYQKNNSV
jgi:hypothetical protein